MTYIELFDKTGIENICTSLTHPPQRVILIGDKKKRLEACGALYRRVLLDQGSEVEFLCRCVNKNDLQEVLRVLSELVETYDDCVFDLTGGEDMLLFACGILLERYKDKHLQMHRFNLHNNTIIDCDLDGRTIYEGSMPQLSVEENVRIYGGEVVYADEKPGTTLHWELTDAFVEDVDYMWEVCRPDVRRWNTQMGVLMVAEQFRVPGDDSLTLQVPLEYLKERLQQIGAAYIFDTTILRALYQGGLIDIFEGESILSVVYKDEQVKRCLTKAGQALELKMYLAALRAQEKDGAYTYNDVKTGVYIDWDGAAQTESDRADTMNEIDVLLMHGAVPVFVSCKNGYVDMDELYKLDTVADRFGGQYAKKVLVATALEQDSPFAAVLRQRAREMNIRLVEDIQDMDDTELQRIVRSFWNV